MPEEIFYRGEYEGATALGAALPLIGLDTLRNSRIKHLYTSKFGGLDDKFATGIGGTDSNHRLTWSVRWDWDPEKNTHVNVVLTSPAEGTKKYAFLHRGRDDAVQKEYLVENPYIVTIRRFTSDCQWNEEYADSLQGHEQAAYRVECAENGRNRWCYVLGAHR